MDRARTFGIYVYGDSLSMPRAVLGIRLTDTYPELLAESIREATGRRVIVWNRSGGALTIRNLQQSYFNDFPYFDPSERQMLILQFGVVDCAPRPLPRLLRGVLSRAPRNIREPVVHWLHEHRAPLLRAGVRFQIVGEKPFREKLLAWIRHATAAFDRVILIGIAPINAETHEQSPGFSIAIKRYNGIMAETVRTVAAENLSFIDVHREILEGGIGRLIDRDGHHLTLAAHAFYARLLSRFVISA